MTSGEAAANLTETVRRLVEAMVDRPEQVRVTARLEGRYVQMCVAVAPEETGKMIGRQGRTARALRTVSSAVAGKLDLGCELMLVQEDGSQVPR